jgi:hypothetical protein
MNYTGTLVSTKTLNKYLVKKAMKKEYRSVPDFKILFIYLFIIIFFPVMYEPK